MKSNYFLTAEQAARRRAKKLRRKLARKAAIAAGKASRQKKIIPAFYGSHEWRALRYDALKRDDGKCVLCGRSAADGFVMNVDHIEPIKRCPDLALVLSNLQTLCAICNEGKGNRDNTDWRGRPSMSVKLDMMHLADLRERGLLH